MTNRLIPRQSLSDEVVAKLKDLILDGALKPGDRLPTEQELASQFGVSRLSIREATKALRYLGVIHSSQKRGQTVGRLDLARLSECLDFHAIVSSYPDEQILRARMAIEMGILPQVMQQMARNPGLYDRLYALTALPGITTDPDIYVEADLAFHSGLVAAADVQPLAMFSELLRTFFVRFHRQAVGSEPAAMENGVRLHRRIIEALRAGELETAQTLVLNSFGAYATETNRRENVQ